MTNSPHILILSKDPDFFQQENKYQTEVIQRHIKYFKELRSRDKHARITIFTIINKKNSNAKNYQVFHGNLEIYGLLPPKRFLYLLYLTKALFSWIWIEGNRPSLITTQTPWEEGVLGYFISKISKSSFLPQIHFDLLSAAWLHESKFNYWRYRVSRFILRRSNYIRVVSHFQKEKISHTFNIDKEKIFVVPALTRIFESKVEFKAKRNIKEFNILFVGRFVETKNLQLWTDVARKLSSRDNKFSFTLIGNGPLKEKLKKNIENGPLKYRVKFLSYLNEKELITQLSSSSLLLLTSHYEGFGRVLVEAQSLGLLVASTDSGGPSDIIEHKKTGLLFENNSSEHIANEIEDLSNNLELQADMRYNALNTTREFFSEEKIAADLVDLWIFSGGKSL